jgi:hypothetical protein
MTFPDQIDKLVAKLTELTFKDKVDWQETGNPNTYLAPVDRFAVTINKGGSELYGGYSFQILDGAGRAIEVAPAPYSSQQKSRNRMRIGSASATSTKSPAGAPCIPKKWSQTCSRPWIASLRAPGPGISRNIKVYLQINPFAR